MVVASAQLLLFFLIPFLPLPLPMTPDISKAKFGYKQLACVRELGRRAAARQGWEEREGGLGAGREDPAQEVGPGPVLTVGQGLQAWEGLQGPLPSAPRSPDRGLPGPSSRSSLETQSPNLNLPDPVSAQDLFSVVEERQRPCTHVFTISCIGVCVCVRAHVCVHVCVCVV